MVEDVAWAPESANPFVADAAGIEVCSAFCENSIYCSLRETWNKIRPQSFATPGMRGYQALRLQDGRHSTQETEHARQVLKTRVFSITLLVRVALVLEVVSPNFSFS